jgi:hypothetical protein
MNLADVMDEIAAVLKTITGLRVTAWPPGSIVPPGGAVSYPEQFDYDLTYGRGTAKITGIPVVLIAGRATTRAARDAVSAWTATSGAKSVPATFEAHHWASCDDLQVVRSEYDVHTVGGVDYMAALFSVDVVGSGSV